MARWNRLGMAGKSALSRPRARGRQERLERNGVERELTPTGQAHARRALPESESSTDQATLRTIEAERNAALVVQGARLERVSHGARLERVGECA